MGIWHVPVKSHTDYVPPEFDPGESYTAGNEGCRLGAYQDTGGVWTIGYGVTGPEIGPGVVWTQRQADYEFMVRYASARLAASRVAGQCFAALAPWRQYALVDIAYECGQAGLAKFEKMLSAVRNEDWATASAECLDSELPRGRAQKNAAALLTGESPT